MKSKNIVRIIFALLFVFCITTICIKYNSFEQRILLFEAIRVYLFIYCLAVELPLVIIRNRNKWNKFWEKLVLYLLILFSIFSLLVAGVDVYCLTRDVLDGYQEKKITVIKRQQQFRASDKVWVNDDDKVQTYYLAPGYIKVTVGDAYRVRFFKHSKIIIPVNMAD